MSETPADRAPVPGGPSRVRLEISERRAFAGGRAFGEAGPYERLEGRLHFAVDPLDPANAGIVDLGRAPRDGEGRVAFSADLCLLQPSAAQGSSGPLLLEVPNRGRKGALHRFNRPAGWRGQSAAGPASDGGIEIGDGLLLSLGWTVAWIGWQWDVLRDLTPEGLVGFDAPQAVDAGGAPIQGQVLLEWQPDGAAPHLLLADRVHRPYAAASLDQPDAVLTTREWPGAPPRTVPRGEWRFGREEGGEVVPDDTHVWLRGGFRPGVIYDLTFTTRECPVVGAGLLALRDGTAFLRYGSAGDGNPCAGRVQHALAYGASQCGRLLRQFMHLGLNHDGAGRRVFDGLLIHVAGSRQGEFNHRYAQPSAITIPGFGHHPPFRFDGWPEDTRVIATNSSSEYWNREASLLHTGDAGEADVEPPAQVRVYHFAGTKHGAGSLPVAAVADGAETAGAAGGPPAAVTPLENMVDYWPLMRAALFNLQRWVAQGTPPPPSVFPRLANGTAAPPEAVLAAFRRLPGVDVVDPQRLYRRGPLDLGPDAGGGIGRYPARASGEPFRWYVPAVDADGNETAGVRLPDVAVPVATHTGWLARREGTGGAGQNVDMLGASVPFQGSVAGRGAADDPRPAIAERYRDAAEYETLVREVAHRLVAAGYLVAEDADLVVDNAMARYRALR